MLLRYFLKDFEIGPIVVVVTGISFVITFLTRPLSIVKSLYFRILFKFLAPKIPSSITIHVPFLSSPIIMSGLLLGMFLSVCTCWFHNLVTLFSWLASPNFVHFHTSFPFKILPLFLTSGKVYHIALYRVSQEECARLRENVPQVKIHRYNPKHLYPKLNGYGENGERSLKLRQLLHTYWLPNTY